MEIKEVKIDELKPAEYNPRAMNEKEAADLTESINRFGVVEPIVVNSAPGRENVIIGGHQRFFICQKMGRETMPVVYISIPDIAKEQELNLRLNKNLGHWDWDLLANFDEEMLKGVGFDPEELMQNFGLDEAFKQEVDESRFQVLTIEPPEAPRLKERVSIYFEDIEEYKKVKKAVEDGLITKDRLLELI